MLIKFNLGMVVLELLINSCHVLLDFGALQSELTEIVVDHSDTVLDLFVGEMLDALADLGEDG